MNEQQYQYLQKIDKIIVSVNPKYVTWGAVVCVTAWAWLIIQAAGVAEVGINVGPGMKPLYPFLTKIAELANEITITKAILKLCVPQDNNVAYFSGILLMWIAMSVAMMMPAAMPMFKTYADIANLAKQQKKEAQPVYVLASGYLASWVVFSIVAAAVQTAAIQFGWLTSTSPQYQIAPVVLIGAGLYQFSSLKYACLKKCQNPFATLFAQWKTSANGVIKLGIKQGIYCIGCCWALMGVMVVVGTMNVAWMAFFAVLTIAEKNTASGKKISIMAGIIFIIWGVISFVYS